MLVENVLTARHEYERQNGHHRGYEAHESVGQKANLNLWHAVEIWTCYCNCPVALECLRLCAPEHTLGMPRNIDDFSHCARVCFDGAVEDQTEPHVRGTRENEEEGERTRERERERERESVPSFTIHHTHAPPPYTPHHTPDNRP